MAEVEDSILNTTKKLLGFDADYTAFDTDIIIHINSTFTLLQQLGVGPETGFLIVDDKTTWSEFIGDETIINAVRSYMYLRVRLMFDPPATSYLIESIRKQATELEWRLNVQMEGVRHPWTGAPKDPQMMF